MRLLRASDYKIMPWKNGGGTTVEIAVSPEGSDLAGFLWRISIAEVRASGPFSKFKGYERTIMLIDGQGMILEAGDTGSFDLTRAFEPKRFSGDLDVYGRLLGGPVKDFNLIVKRGRVQGHVDALRMHETLELSCGTGETLVCTVLVGALSGAANGETLMSQEGLVLNPASDTPALVAVVRVAEMGR